ncbi:MAG: hypothetical protein GQ583_07795 [Methyloprofundus sp.]|nr:hypothetical protein [Methyloprofundus sp.]
MRGLLFLLFGFCSQVFAEQSVQTNKVYNKNSQSAIDKLNKVVEVVRDPTALSNNFRKALRNLPVVGDSTDDDQNKKDLRALGIPEIDLVAKVFSEHAPATVVLKANGKYHHFEEGDQISKVINNEVVTMHVQEISKHTVRLLIMPFNKTLIFN